MILLINDNMLCLYAVPRKKNAVSIYQLACVALIIASVLRILFALRLEQKLACDTLRLP